MKQLYVLIMYLAFINLQSCGFMKYTYDDNSITHPKLIKSSHDQVLVESFKQEFKINDENTSLAPALMNTCQLSSIRRIAYTLYAYPHAKTGSAALIDGRFLITAAHNTHNYDNFNFLSNLNVSCNTLVSSGDAIDVHLGWSETSNNITTQKYQTRWWPFNRNRQFEYDFSFVDLGETLDIKSSFKLDSKISQELKVGDIVGVTGYPGDKYDGKHLAVGVGKVIEVNGNHFLYDVDTFTGNSGGPVWVKKGENYYLVGVHVADAGLGGKARLLNESFFKEWVDWKATR